MSSLIEEKTLTLISKDYHLFTVKESVAVQCLTLKHMVEDGCADQTIPIPSADGKTLALLLEYLNLHSDSAVSNEDKQKFDSGFAKRNDVSELMHLILAANHLHAKCLMEFLMDALANRIETMNVEEVREIFNVENDYTVAEEADMQQKHSRDLINFKKD